MRRSNNVEENFYMIKIMMKVETAKKSATGSICDCKLSVRLSDIGWFIVHYSLIVKH